MTQEAPVSLYEPKFSIQSQQRINMAVRAVVDEHPTLKVLTAYVYNPDSNKVVSASVENRPGYMYVDWITEDPYDSEELVDKVKHRGESVVFDGTIAQAFDITPTGENVSQHEITGAYKAIPIFVAWEEPVLYI